MFFHVQTATGGRVPRRVSGAVTRWLVGLFLLLLLWATPGGGLAPARAQAALVTGFGGPDGFGTNELPAADDTSSPEIDLTPAFPNGLHFFGSTYTGVYVNTNGLLSFGSPVTSHTSTPFPVGSTALIAPWWGDVDTRNQLSVPNRIYYHLDTANGRFIVTWFEVGYFNQHVNWLNSFQVILIDRSTVQPGEFDIEFRYNRCEWTTGDASGGSNGFGGTEAQAGYDAGDLTHYYALPGSQTPAVLNLCTTSNVNDTGVWQFEIRRPASCGNGIVEAGEVCDDGNTVGGDGCSADCLSDETCGNGIVDGGEVCDDGNTTAGDGCAPDCLSDETCGNGTVDASEVCDDGNTVGGDGCSADCLSDETCGNGIVDGGEVCDDGNTVDGDGCASDCLSDETCGNGTVDASEVCDDGNTVDGDGCASDCLSDETCGNGIVDVGEACDDGNTDDGDGCDATCAVEGYCGDGQFDAGEECDDGNIDDGDGCDATCAVEDGYSCVGEPSVCAPTGAQGYCGDGQFDVGEECDDGNADGGDGCSATCGVEDGFSCVGEPSVCEPSGAVCGDGVVEASEECDDGNTDDGDGCSAVCEAEESPPADKGGCSSSPTGSAPQPATLLLLLVLLGLLRRRRR